MTTIEEGYSVVNASRIIGNFCKTCLSKHVTYQGELRGTKEPIQFHTEVCGDRYISRFEGLETDGTLMLTHVASKRAFEIESIIEPTKIGNSTAWLEKNEGRYVDLNRCLMMLGFGVVPWTLSYKSHKMSITMERLIGSKEPYQSEGVVNHHSAEVQDYIERKTKKVEDFSRDMGEFIYGFYNAAWADSKVQFISPVGTKHQGMFQFSANGNVTISELYIP